MLQILLFILKLIGWILLLVLALLILVLAAALFTPLRYQAETSCKGKLSTLEAGIHFQIFFRLVKGSVRYRDGDLSWNIRIAWIRLGNQAEAEHVGETVKENIEESVEEISREITEETVKTNVEENVQETMEENREENVDQNTEHTEKEEVETTCENPVNAPEKAEECEPVHMIEEPAQKAEKNKTETKAAQGQAEADKKAPGDTNEPKKTLTDKIAAVFEKIKYTFDKICAKIRMLLEKAESVKAFLTDDVHQSAFLKCLSELKKMVIRLRPKRIAGEIHFGFEDPSLTGRVLAGASMLYPYWGEHVRCYPDFEDKVLEGEVTIAGALRLLPAAVFAWNLLWSKNVRRTVMDAKRFIFK